MTKCSGASRGFIFIFLTTGQTLLWTTFLLDLEFMNVYAYVRSSVVTELLKLYVLQAPKEVTLESHVLLLPLGMSCSNLKKVSHLCLCVKSFPEFVSEASYL